MTSVKRRAALKSCGAVLLAGLTGCSQLKSPLSSKALKLEAVTVENQDAAPHTARVLILKDDEPMYSNSVTVDGLDQRFDTVGEGNFTDVPPNPGPAVLYAWVDDQRTTAWKRFDFTDSNNDCVGLHLKIQPTETRQEPTLTLLSHSECSTPTSSTDT